MQKILLGLFFLAIGIDQCHSQSISSYAKTCGDCNGTNAICNQYANYVTCSCKSGYAGNGYNCTLLVDCNTEKCCLPGYVWDTVRKACTDVNECATPTLNKCLSGNSSDCIDRVGMQLCINNQSRLCSVNPCDKYEDCMKVNSSSSEIECADPCENYSWLDGSSRLYNISSTGRFLTDRYNFGWFRYHNSLGIKYGCVEALKCGSLEPFSLNGSHPSIEEGVKLVPLNINSLTGCRRGSSIPVKACPGGYYVYKFSGNLKYDVYCTESTTPPELPTTKSPTTQTTDPPTTKPLTTPTHEPSTTTQTTDPPTTPTPEPSTTTQTTEPATHEPSTTTQTTDPPTTPTPEPSTTTQTTEPTTPEPSTTTQTTEPTTHEPSTTTQTTDPPTTPTPEPSTTTQSTEPTTPEPSTTTQTTDPPTTPTPEPSTTTQTTEPTTPEPSTTTQTTEPTTPEPSPTTQTTDPPTTPTPEPSTTTQTTDPPTTPTPEPSTTTETTEPATTPTPEPSTTTQTTEAPTTPTPELSTTTQTTELPTTSISEPPTTIQTADPSTPEPSTITQTEPPTTQTTELPTTTQNVTTLSSTTTTPPKTINLKISIFSDLELVSLHYGNRTISPGKPLKVVVEAESYGGNYHVLLVNSFFVNNDVNITLNGYPDIDKLSKISENHYEQAGVSTGVYSSESDPQNNLVSLSATSK